MAYLLPYGTKIDVVLTELDQIRTADESIEQAQNKLADKYGFLTWPQMRVHVDPPTLEDPNFQHLACLTYEVYDHPSRREKAAEMLRENPEFGTEDIYSACITGNVEAVRSMLDAEPELINARGGINDWEPLLYACYARLGEPTPSTLPVVELLLERGADPDAYYMWGGGYRFTALTGAFGEGEQGELNQPEHPNMLEIARLLLDAGANPNDCQSLYNRMFRSSNICLEMLLDYGLHTSHRNNWFVGKDGGSGELIPHEQRTLDYQMNWAATNNHPKRVKLLVSHGVDINLTLTTGERLLRHASLSGYTEIRDFLIEQGAEKERFEKVEKFIVACVNLDRDTAREMLAEDSDLIAKAESHSPHLLSNAAAKNLTEVVRFLIDLGFGIHLVDSQTPLHEAAYHGYLDLVKELVEVHGCDHHLRDLSYSGTPLGWAMQKPQTHVVDYLMTLDLDIFSAIAINDADRVRQLIAADPSVVERSFKEYLDSKATSDEAWQTPLAAAALDNRTEIVGILLDAGANRDIADDRGHTLISLLTEGGNTAMADVLRDV